MTLSILKNKNSLLNQPVFLSASLPNVTRDNKYFETASPTQIVTAVKEIARAILSHDGILVFGGHPTISPLILSVAKNFYQFTKRDAPNIIIYQSNYFKDVISENTLKLANEGYGIIYYTEPSDSRDKSLAIMRNKMLSNYDFIAAIFIGGMEGIEDEYNLFTRKFPNKPVYPIARPGGASRFVLEDYKRKHSGNLLIKKLEDSNSYPYLAKVVIDDIIKNLTDF